MNENIKVIEGLNKEKEILTQKLPLCADNNAGRAVSSSIHSRLTEIDKFLKELVIPKITHTPNQA